MKILTTLMQGYIRFTESLNEIIGRAVSWLTTALVLLICADVAARHLLNFSSAAVFELEWHLFAIIFLIGAGYTLKDDKHVRVDILYARLSPKRQALINLFGVVFFLVPFCLIVIKSGLAYTMASFNIGESSTDPGGLPYRFLIKSTIPMGFVLLLMQGIALAFRSLLTLSGNQHPSNTTLS